MRYLVSFMVVLALALMPAMARADVCDCDDGTDCITPSLDAASDSDLDVDESFSHFPGTNTKVEYRWNFHRTDKTTGVDNSIRATIDGTDVLEQIWSDVEPYDEEDDYCINGTGNITGSPLQSHMELVSGDTGFYTKLKFRYRMYKP